MFTDSQQQVETVLPPFQEYEYARSKDDYVTRVDMTDELTKEFKEGKISMSRIGTGPRHLRARA